MDKTDTNKGVTLATIINRDAPKINFEGGEPKWSVKFSDRERQIIEDSKLSGRLSNFLYRGLSTKGEISHGKLKDAIKIKKERFKGSKYINTAPVGPGCNWLSVGPRNINGRIKCMAIHPINNQILYAGAPNGGVWKSIDGGQSWIPKMHDQDSLAIGAITLDPSTPDTIYAGTGEPVYLLSSGVVQPPGSPIVAWYYPGVGVYKSTDGGDNWTLTGSIQNDFIYRIAVDPNNSNNLLCAGFSFTAGQGGLCQSTDGGTTWNTLLNGIFTDVLFDPNNAGRAYAAQNGGGVFKSTDSGGTWNAKNTGLPTPATTGRINLSIANSNSNVLYAKIENNSTTNILGVYRTASAAEAPGGWAVVTNPGIDNGFLWWCSYIAADPADATGNTVYSGGVDVARSADGGTTWTQITDAYGGTLPPTHPDQHDLVFDPTNSAKFFIANDGGIFQGQFTGGTPPVNWKKLSTGLVVTQFYDLHSSPASRSMFGGGAQDNGSMVSTGGQSWRHVFGGDGGYVAFHPTDPYTYYIQWQNANIQKTTDGGNTFVSAKSGISGSGTFPATVFAIDNNNPQILFSGTNRVYRTTNGGTGAGAWSAASAAIGRVTDIAIAPSTSAVIYAGTITGTLHQATDGGATNTSFAAITPTVAAWPARWLAGITVHPTDSNTIYVTFLGFNNSAGNTSDHVWKGVFNPGPATWSWNLIAGGLPDVPVASLVIHPSTMDLYIATDIGVFRSQDDGLNWTPFEAGLPNVPVVDLHLDPVMNKLRAATHGRGMYQIDLTGPCAEVDIYLRDNILDTGEILPSPSGVPDPTQPGVVVRHYKSADIKVDAPLYNSIDALLDGVEFDDPEHPYTGFGVKIEDIDGIEHNSPIRSQTNRVYVQIHNRGWNKTDSITLKLLWADAGAGLPALPADYWTNFPGDGFDQTNWKPIGTHTFTDVLPNVPQIKKFDWVPPGSTSDHVCLLAMIDSTQDPLLPQTLFNVDNLTLSNKKITHRNVHPVNASSPGGAPMWAAMNFSNAFRESKLFDFRLENITDSKRTVRLILPELKLQNDITQSLKGFRLLEMHPDKWRATVEFARRRGEISDYVLKKLDQITKPVLLETVPGATKAVLSGAIINPDSMLTGIIAIQGTQGDEKTRSFHMDVTQYTSGKLVGGSELFLAAPKKDAIPDKPHVKRTRIVLEKVQILDDKDPWIFGRGELYFRTLIKIDGDPVKGQRVRIPESGIFKVSDLKGKNILNLDETIFEGCVFPGERMEITLCASEEDIFTNDDPFVRYRRTFTGNPTGWHGNYRPDDELNDAESMNDWKIWYRIEEA